MARASAASPARPLPLLLLLAVGGWGAVEAMPQWDWDHIQTFAHCANVTGPLSPSALAAFKPHGFVILEKFHQMSNPPVNRSGEQKIYKQAKILKAGNPQQEVYIYVAVDVVRGYYDGWAYFDRHPDTELHDRSAPPAQPCHPTPRSPGAVAMADGSLVTEGANVVSEWPGAHVFDFAQPAGRAAWNKVVTDAIATSVQRPPPTPV